MIRVLFIALSLVIVKQFIAEVEEHDRGIPGQREPAIVRQYDDAPEMRVCDAKFIQSCGELHVRIDVSRERQPPQVEVCAHDIGLCKHIGYFRGYNARFEHS